VSAKASASEFLVNLQDIKVLITDFEAIGVLPHFPLVVWWKGDDDLEIFTLRCRREDQMRQWEAQMNRLIKEVARRRGSERVSSGISRILSLSRFGPLAVSDFICEHCRYRMLSTSS